MGGAIVVEIDRDRGHRVPFLSAMDVIGAEGCETLGYLKIDDALGHHTQSTIEHGRSARQYPVDSPITVGARSVRNQTALKQRGAPIER